MYQERIYRTWVKADDLVKFHVSEKETDLLILAERDLTKVAQESIHKYRTQLEGFIKICPEFRESLAPIEVQPSTYFQANSSENKCWAGGPIVKEMVQASKAAGVGPMAAVAGAMAEFVGRDLMKHSKEIIVENGGDIFLKTNKTRSFGIFAGNSPLTGKLGFEIISLQYPLGVCTSSGTVGHSLSFGKADAVVVISRNTALADAVATGCANLAKTKNDIEKTIDFARSIPGVLAAIVVIGDRFGSWGRKGFKWSLKN